MLLSLHRKLLDAAKDRLELVLKRDPLSSGVKKLSLAKLTNGYAATSASHKEELLGGYAKSNLYNGVKTGGYAEPPARQPLPMEEGGCAGAGGGKSVPRLALPVGQSSDLFCYVLSIFLVHVCNVADVVIGVLCLLVRQMCRFQVRTLTPG